MSRAAYLRAWKSRNRERMAEYNRRYRQRLAASPKLATLRRKRGLEHQRRYRAATVAENRIQQRMLHRGRPVTVPEARELLAEYGPDYPLSRGLTHQQSLWARRHRDAGREGRGPVESWDYWVFEAYEVQG